MDDQERDKVVKDQNTTVREQNQSENKNPNRSPKDNQIDAQISAPASTADAPEINAEVMSSPSAENQP